MCSSAILIIAIVVTILQTVNSFLPLSYQTARRIKICKPFNNLVQLSRMLMSERNPRELSVNVQQSSSSGGTVEIYSTLGCKFCRISKAKLDEIGVQYLNVDITEPAAATIDAERQNVRVEYARQRTVPQIYVNDEHVGGCDNLLSEISSGEFFNRLERNNIEIYVSASSATTPILHSKAPSSVKTMNNADLPSPEVFKREGVLNSITNDIMSKQDMRKRFTLRSSGEKEDPLLLSAALQRQALQLTDKFAQLDGSRVDYKAMRTSLEFEEYVMLSETLQDCSLADLSALSTPKRLSFFVNLYNAIIIHANCILVRKISS